MLKILLDVDGVLTTHHRMVELAALHKAGRGVAPDRKIRSQEELDPVAMVQLNRLVRATGADVVITSAWRRTYSLHDLRAMFKAAGFEGWIENVTPIRQAPRGLEIQEWITGAGVEPSEIVILDDGADMGHLSDRLVRTTYGIGLTVDHVDRAIVLLRGEPPELQPQRVPETRGWR